MSKKSKKSNKQTIILGVDVLDLPFSKYSAALKAYKKILEPQFKDFKLIVIPKNTSIDVIK